MTYLSDEVRAREDGEQGLFARFRSMLAGRNDTETLRDTIEELIELEEVGQGADNAEELSLLRNVLSVRDVAVEDVMVPLSKILAHMGDKKHPHDQMVTPYFLLSREICEDKLGVSDVDALDEVMECYATIGSAYPAFAKYFWMRHSEADGNASKLCQVMDSSLPSEFLFRVVEERIDEPSL